MEQVWNSCSEEMKSCSTMRKFKGLLKDITKRTRGDSIVYRFLGPHI